MQRALPETLTSVGDFLAEPELKSLTLTDRRLHNIFERILYRSARCNETARNLKELRYAGILRAAQHANVEAVRKFISYGADVNQQDLLLGETALHKAAEAGSIAMIEILLDCGADMNIQEKDGHTPLDIAVRCTNFHLLEVFARYDPEPKAFNTSQTIWPGILPEMLRPLRKRIRQLFLEGHPDAPAFFDQSLICAALDGDVDDMQGLMDWKSNSPAPEFAEIFALWAAVQGGNIEVLKMLVGSGGACVKLFSDDLACPPPIYTALKNGEVEMVRYLHEQGAYLNYPDGETKPFQAPAFGAAASRDLNMLDLFISLGGKLVEPADDPNNNALLNAIAPPTTSPLSWGSLTISNMTSKNPFSVAVLQRLVELGADVNAPNGEGATPLCSAIVEQSVEAVKFLLAKGADADAYGSSEITPLYQATQVESNEILEVLLQHGADPNKPTDGGVPLALVSTGEQASLLLKYGALLEEKASWLTPLSSAADRGLPDVMAVLLEAGASITCTDDVGHYPIFTALYSEEREQAPAMIRLLLQHGGPVNLKAPSPCEGEALSHAVTPLAGQTPDLEVVKLLLDAGADIHAQTPDGQNCVHDACCEPRFTDVLRLLIEYGGDVSSRTRDGLTPLHIATRHARPEIVSILLEHNAPVNAQLQNGRTPLAFARADTRGGGYSDIVAMLLAHGACPNIRKPRETGPLKTAISKGLRDLVLMLLDHGADVNGVYDDGRTALTVATLAGNEPIVSTLLSRGAQLDTTDDQGMTALDWAVRLAPLARQNETEVVKVLRDAGATSTHNLYMEM